MSEVDSILLTEHLDLVLWNETWRGTIPRFSPRQCIKIHKTWLSAYFYHAPPPLTASLHLQTSCQCSPTSAGYFLQTKELAYMTSPCDHRPRVSALAQRSVQVRFATKTTSNRRFGGAVVYVTVSSSWAECKLFEIRGSIFNVGDPTLAAYRGRIIQWRPVDPDDFDGRVCSTTSTTMHSNYCLHNMRILSQLTRTCCIMHQALPGKETLFKVEAAQTIQSIEKTF